MALFKKQDKFIIQPPLKSRIDIEVEKTANKEALEKAMQSTKHLNNLLTENGFTIKIYLAAGGKKK